MVTWPRSKPDYARRTMVLAAALLAGCAWTPRAMPKYPDGLAIVRGDQHARGAKGEVSFVHFMVDETNTLH